MSRDEIRDRLGERSAPGEHQAESRAWEVVRQAHGEATPRRRHRRKGFFGGLLASVAAIALVLTPAGAQVREWVGDVVDPPGIERAEKSLGPLPGGGRLLVDSRSGSWLVGEDGSRERLGGYDGSTWSPRGLYAALSNGSSLAAVDVNDEIGDVRWTLDADARVHDQVWAPSGQRVAYLAGRELRVVAGDGSSDRMVRRAVAAVGPAWAPEPEYTGELDEPYPRHILAYVDSDRRTVRVIRADTGVEMWSQRARRPVVDIEWSDRGRLAVLTDRDLRYYTEQGRAEETFGFSGYPRVGPALGMSAGQDETLAARHFDAERGRSSVDVLRSPTRIEAFSGPGRFTGATLSPGGKWILIEWRAADQWLFVSSDGQRVRGVSGISNEFDRGSGAADFPSVGGWCCG